MTWTLRDAKRERAITDRIEQGDDRSAGILAGALIQDRLIKAIKTRFVNDTNVNKAVFENYGPLSDFRSQIDIAYLLKVIERPTREHLHIIRKIRNTFAHELEAHDFNNRRIRDLCNNLWGVSKIKDFRDYILQKFNKSNILAATKILLTPIVNLPETSRNSYMGTIKVHLFWMEMSTWLAEQDIPSEERHLLGLDLAQPDE